MKSAAIIVDVRHIRCDNCKVALHDETATACPTCGVQFDRVVSNHVGLAEKFQRKRDEMGIGQHIAA